MVQGSRTHSQVRLSNVENRRPGAKSLLPKAVEILGQAHLCQNATKLWTHDILAFRRIVRRADSFLRTGFVSNTSVQQ